MPIVLRAIDTRLRRACPDAPAAARFGAVSFPQRFGSALNAHIHLHCCVIDGVFSEAGGASRFHPARFGEADLQAVQRAIRTRVLRAAVRHGALTAETAEELSHWAHGGGFSLHAGVLIEAEDRPALERLELLDRLAALIPPPRRHRHHYHGVFAPHSPLRARVTAGAGQGLAPSAAVNTALSAADTGRPGVAPPTAPRAEAADAGPPSSARRRAAYAWVRLIAFITEPAAIHAILVHLGEPTTSPPLAPPARAPPPCDLAQDEATCALDQSSRWDESVPAPDPTALTVTGCSPWPVVLHPGVCKHGQVRWR